MLWFGSTVFAWVCGCAWTCHNKGRKEPTKVQVALVAYQGTPLHRVRDAVVPRGLVPRSEEGRPHHHLLETYPPRWETTPLLSHWGRGLGWGGPLRHPLRAMNPHWPLTRCRTLSESFRAKGPQPIHPSALPRKPSGTHNRQRPHGNPKGRVNGRKQRSPGPTHKITPAHPPLLPGTRTRQATSVRQGFGASLGISPMKCTTQ